MPQPDSDIAATKCVVGLGNPGREYRRSRHNVGFMVVEALAERWGAGRGRRAFDGRLREARPTIGGAPRRVMLLQPQTYMNRSGSAASAMVRFYKADPPDVLLVLDDMALPLGRLRFRTGGSSGGHRGLADVLAALGSEQVPRLRIGIGVAPPGVDGTEYVLTAFAADERETMDQAVRQAAAAVEEWITLGITSVMDKYNRKGDSDTALTGPPADEPADRPENVENGTRA
ncbi:MAG: aminoacyl-tRNA hydrolase [Phycisphaerae bacterium]|nr:aminoacyl-tRNA hydrolase [Phycisphaerae bacterium]